MAHDGSAPAEAEDVAGTFTVGQTVGQPAAQWQVGLSIDSVTGMRPRSR